MSYLKHPIRAALSCLFPVALSAAVLDFSPPLQNITVTTAGNPATTVLYSVFDPAVGSIVQGTDNTGQVSGRQDAHGVVTWNNGSQVFCRVYEPSAQAWIKTNLFNGATSDLTTSHGVVAWTIPGAAIQFAWDRSRNAWVGSSTGFAGSASSLRSSHGHVAWIVGTHVYYRAYDPVAGQWVGGSIPFATSIFDLTLKDGSITWSVNVGLGLSDIYMLTYDPSRAAWGQASQRTGNTFDLRTDNGLIAWSDNLNGVIYCFAYDPARGIWAGNATASGATQNLQVQTGTVFWSANNVDYVRGYNTFNGLWTNSFTVPFAAFGVTPTQGDAPLKTTFFDSSLGGSSWSWNFGDGTSDSRRSPTHVYTNFNTNLITLTLLGPGGGPVSTTATVRSDITPPSGTLVINGGDTTTSNAVVQLALSATDNSGVVTEMRFGNNASVWSPWQPFTTNHSWILLAGDGIKTVYAQFRDAAQNPSGTASDTIMLDSTAFPVAQFEMAHYMASESDGTLQVRVQLSNAFGSNVSIDYSTMDGSAVAGEDYQATSGRLHFVPSQTEQTFLVTLNSDTNVEPNQSFTLTLSNPTNAVAGGPATVTLIDDDFPRVFFSAVEYSVMEDAGTAQIGVSLEAPSGQTVSVRYTTTNGTAQAGVDYEPSSGILTFSPNQTFLTFPVPIVDDTHDEPLETVGLMLYEAINGILSAPSNAVLRLQDDDPPSANFNQASYSTAENSGSLTLSVSLSKAWDQTVFIDVATSNQTAIAGQDYSPVFTTLIFGPGQTNKPVSLTLINDVDMENSETLLLTLFAPIHATLGPRAQVVVRIDDDDAPRFTSHTLNALGRFEATITGRVGEIFLMQASTNYNQWFPLELLTNLNGTVLFSDPATPSFPYRAYRVRIFNP